MKSCCRANSAPGPFPEAFRWIRFSRCVPTSPNESNRRRRCSAPGSTFAVLLGENDISILYRAAVREAIPHIGNHVIATGMRSMIFRLQQAQRSHSALLKGNRREGILPSLPLCDERNEFAKNGIAVTTRARESFGYSSQVRH